MPRSWRDVPILERDSLLKVYEESDPASVPEETFLALDLNMSLISLNAKLREHRNYSKIYKREAANSVKMPPSPSRSYLDYEVLDGDDWIIGSDIELPDHSPLYLERLILTGMAHGIRRLIIAGDYIATDQASLNEWVNLWRTEDLSYEDAINMAKDILIRLGSWFKEIVMIEGNHDDRISRATKGEVHLGMFLAGDNVRYSRYSYLWVKTSKGFVYVCHPRQYSANSAGLGQRLYNTLTAPDGTKPIAVVVAHTHQAQTAVSPDGRAVIVALGTLRDKDRTKYKATSATTHHEWENGFLMIRKAFFYPLTSRSDWAFWLGEFYPDPIKETVSA